MQDMLAVSEINPGAVTVGDMEFAMRFSESMAKSAVTIPKHLVGKPSDCMAIILQAKRWGMDPFAVAQGTALINGALSYSAQLVSAVVSSSGAIDGSFVFEYSGPWKSDKDPDAWVKCGAKLKGQQETTWGEPIYPAAVTTKNSPLWKSAPKQQASYLAVKYWARLYAPGAILGVSTRDDIQPQQERDITPEARAANGRLGSAIERSDKFINGLRQDQAPADDREQEPPENTLLNAINAANTTKELREAVENIDDYDLSESKKLGIRRVYQAALTALTESESIDND